MEYTIINGELHHWGIKGQKWGVRRYQNSDGSLTPAGVKRYGSIHQDYEKAHSKRSIQSMSDKELRDRINRVRMEKEYKDMTSVTSKGKRAIKAFIATAGTITAVTAAAATYKKVGLKIGNGAMDKIGNIVLKSINIGSLDG